MTWQVWACGQGDCRPRCYSIPAPSAAAACAFVLAGLRRGRIVDCAPLCEVLGVRL
jgi:hypothetical protein